MRSLASQIVAVGDMDALTSRTGHRAMLDSVEQIERADLDQKAREYVGAIEHKIDYTNKLIQERADRRDKYNQQYADQHEYSQVWRDQGIRSRFALIQAPILVRILTWIVFAGVDFYLFAEAMVVALNEDNQDSSGLLGYSTNYWTGGIMGLMVFALGVALSHLIRQRDYIRAQTELKQEIEETEGASSDLRTSANSNAIFIIVSILFGILTFAVLLVRADGIGFRFWPLDVKRLGPLLMQMLVPFVAVGIEAIMHDPTSVHTKNNNIMDAILRRRIRNLERKKQDRQITVNKMSERISNKYSYERGVLDVIHDSHGF
jgi:hypothetical protein